MHQIPARPASSPGVTKPSPLTAPVHMRPVMVSPFEVAVRGGGRRTAPRTKAQLLSLSRTAERRQLRSGKGDLVLIVLQDVRFWTPRTAAVYREIAAAGAMVVIFCGGMETDLTGPARGEIATVAVGTDDLLRDEWLVIFCSERQRWGFLAREESAGLPGARSGPREAPESEEARFDVARTFLWADLKDPVWLERAAAVLLTRVPELSVRVPWLRP